MKFIRLSQSGNGKTIHIAADHIIAVIKQTTDTYVYTSGHGLFFAVQESVADVLELIDSVPE